jgi:hypothetical protein
VQVTSPTFLPLLAPAGPERAAEGAVLDQYCGDLSIVYSFGPPFGKRIVTHADLQRMDLNRRVLHRTALDRLETLAGRAQFHGQPPALMLSFDGLESSLLLAEAFWARMRAAVPGEIVVGVPARDVVIVTGSQSGAGLEKARRAVDRVFFAGDDNLLTPRLLVRRGNGWEPFDGAPRRTGSRIVPHPGDQRPRQYQEHPSWPQQRVPVSSMRPISPIDRVGPRPVPGPRPMPTGPLPSGPTPVGPTPVGPAPLAPAAELASHRAVPHQPSRGYEQYGADVAPRSAVPFGPVAKPAYRSDERPVPAQPVSAVPQPVAPPLPTAGSSPARHAAPARPGWSAPAQPTSSVPYSSVPYSAAPYSAPPSTRPYPAPSYSAAPASAPPSSVQPYSAPPYSAAPASAPPASAPPASAPPYAAPPAQPSTPVYPASWGASPDSAPVRPAWDGRTGARARFSR